MMLEYVWETAVLQAILKILIAQLMWINVIVMMDSSGIVEVKFVRGSVVVQSPTQQLSIVSPSVSVKVDMSGLTPATTVKENVVAQSPTRQLSIVSPSVSVNLDMSGVKPIIAAK